MPESNMTLVCYYTEIKNNLKKKTAFLIASPALISGICTGHPSLVASEESLQTAASRRSDTGLHTH